VTLIADNYQYQMEWHRRIENELHNDTICRCGLNINVHNFIRAKSSAR